MLQLNSKEVICHLCKGHLPYSGNMTNLLYHLWICYMEEHKTLKYRDYRDKLYMIIGIEDFDDTHPYIEYLTNNKIYVLLVMVYY